MARAIPRSGEQGSVGRGIEEVEMPIWLWVTVGLVSFLALPLLVGLAVARILGTIGREVSELYEMETWSSMPPARALEDAGDEQPQEVATKRRRVIRLR